MFVRAKRIKEKEYGYLVENEWTNRGSRQRVKGYLGKVHRLEPQQDLQALNFDNLSFQDTIKELVRAELIRHGFVAKGDYLQRDNIRVHVDEMTIRSGSRNAVLAMHEGFLCQPTMKELMNFQPGEEDTGLRLATALVGAGLQVPQDVFVKLFEKIMPASKTTPNKVYY